MTDVITEKPHLMPYDDNYVLISKRRLMASSNCITAMANLISGFTNTSRKHLISQFVQESINIFGTLTQSEVDQHIETIIGTYNQQPNKSA